MRRIGQEYPGAGFELAGGIGPGQVERRGAVAGVEVKIQGCPEVGAGEERRGYSLGKLVESGALSVVGRFG